MNDIELLKAATPTAEDLAAAGVEIRGDLLIKRVLAVPQQGGARTLSRPSRIVFRRPVFVVGALVAAAIAVVASVVLPVDSPGGPSSAVALVDHLVTAARKTSADALLPGQYRYIEDRIVQNGHALTLESWTSGTGEMWRRDTDSSSTEYHHFAAPTGTSPNEPSPSFLASLPTRPDQLGQRLRSVLPGSPASDAELYGAIGDILRTGAGSASLRAAAFQVLATLPMVSARRASDSQKRPAFLLSYPGQTSLLFDPATSALLEEQQGPHFTATYVLRSVVGSLPADVRRHTG